MNSRSLATLLRRWANLRDHGQSVLKAVSWGPARNLVQAGMRDADSAGAELRSLFEYSNKLLSPLCDPLLMDLGMHRWLRAEREEAYSDWLHWVLKANPGQ
jgi:hypothetical protein